MKGVRESISELTRSSSVGSSNTALLFLAFLVSVLVLGYVIPDIIYQNPMGSDAFTHTYNTLKMAESSSLFDFYARSNAAGYLGTDYPIGVWYFGAIVMKVTGLGAFDFAVSFIILLIVISLLVFYAYARKLAASSELSVLSLIFFVSMPLFVLNLLIYSSREFVMVFLLALMYFAVQEFDLKTAVLMVPIVFAIVFSHTGTYIFLIIFSTALFLLTALIWRKFDRGMFFVTAVSFFVYVFAVRAFPFIQPQYIDTGRLVLTISNWISNVLSVNFARNLGVIVYENLFVGNNYIYAIFWSCMVLAAGQLCIRIHDLAGKIPTNRFRAVPLIGNIQSISHGIALTPFWVGPIQAVLAVPGFLRADWRSRGILLALFIAAVLPGAMEADVGTGSLREIYYLFLIIPFLAALGFYAVGIRLRRTGMVLFLLVVFVPLMLMPVIGNLHYQPDISGTGNEKQNLYWLGTVGNPAEGVPAYYYRERINFYANKTTPSIPAGTETRRYLSDLQKTLFANGSEKSTEDLYSYNIRYVIASGKIFESFQKNASDLKADSNLRLDKVYASDQEFGIYRYILDPAGVNRGTGQALPAGLAFSEETPAIQEFGPTFLVENGFYKIRLSRESPQVRYIGTGTENALGEGYMRDTMTISRSGRQDTTFTLDDLDYPDVTINGNVLEYRTAIMDNLTNERLGTLTVTWTFHEKALERETSFANDWLDTGESLGVDHTTTIYAPSTEFLYNQVTGTKEKEEKRVVYPSMDSIQLKDTVFDRIYYSEGETGLLRTFGNSAPYPTGITYRGSTLYDYTVVSTSSGSTVTPSESMHQVEYYAVGDEATAGLYVSGYTSVSPYPFPGGEIPAVIAGFGDWTRAPEDSANGRQVIAGAGLPYAEVDPPADRLAGAGLVTPVGYAALTEGRVKKSSAELQAGIADTRQQLGTSGMAFSSFRYDLDAVKALTDENYSFFFSKTVPSPYLYLNRGGTRDPGIAAVHGNETGLVLIPVARPFSSSLGPLSDYGEALQSWRDTRDSVINDGGIAVYFWDLADIGNPDFTDQFLGFVNESVARGVTFTDPGSIARYTRALRDVKSQVREEMDSVGISAENRGTDDIQGLTYHVQLPAIGGECPYNVLNGTLSRTGWDAGTCDLYVSLDLPAGEKAEVAVVPDIARESSFADIPALYEGMNRVTIRDTQGAPVPGARFIIDGRVSVADRKGEVAFDVRRGTHQVRIEMPGFWPAEFQPEVRGYLFRILNL
ncbi:MAG TPA: hypothetical protein VMB35_06615 [Methanomicrobiales archaeon]|nr:hypothetical protein [Methanomicrobiales archaeon]